MKDWFGPGKDSGRPVLERKHSSSSLARQTLLPSWLRPEVLSPSRVPYTSLSRITKGLSMSYGTPEVAQNTSSPVVKTELSVSGTPTWAHKSRPTRPTATRSCQSQCEVSLGTDQ